MFSYIIRNMYNTIVPSTLESFDGYNTSTRSHYSCLPLSRSTAVPPTKRVIFFFLKSQLVLLLVTSVGRPIQVLVVLVV